MKQYDVAIIGAGVTGTSILYTLKKYTNIKNIVLIEKYDQIAKVQSARTNNSQTLHIGDIESHYTLEKSKSVKKAASYVASYVDAHKGLHRNIPKMLLAVGKEEVKRLKLWYEERKELFPYMRLINREEIATVEPKVIEGRKENEDILAMYTEKGYAIDYGKLSESFVQESGEVDIFLTQKVKKITKEQDYYIIITNKKTLRAKVVVVAISGNSLYFAHQLGYAKNLILLPVAGSFFCGPNYVKGKVYTMQNHKLPFAAVHGDPDVMNQNINRFGPIAKVLPMIERFNYSSVLDFLKLFRFRFDAILSLIKIVSDPIYYRYVLWNMMYDIPYFGKFAFAREIEKIIPTVKGSALKYGKGIGGIRPQIVNVDTKMVEMGEAKIIGNQIIFNITPSPGASVCLNNARIDVKKIVEFLGKEFDEEKFNKDLAWRS
ncbi:FAD-dependent oxidoreductase [Candidatus Woesearchaeota archaeon CG10_big_fil_rev_8_21_14_0_10_32_24]|nr:MAG: FAD-dependent oxidoreductase [Candidatus Woesearchaeota archaeon CG10_big_fil_rev_8_21_14_0_10_32_24]